MPIDRPPSAIMSVSSSGHLVAAGSHRGALIRFLGPGCRCLPPMPASGRPKFLPTYSRDMMGIWMAESIRRGLRACHKSSRWWRRTSRETNAADYPRPPAHYNHRGNMHLLVSSCALKGRRFPAWDTGLICQRKWQRCDRIRKKMSWRCEGMVLLS